MVLHLEPTPEVKTMAARTFPNYKGRKFRLDHSGRPVNVTSYWDGGSRDYYVALNLNTKATLPVPQNGTPFDGGPIAADGVTVPAGYLIANHSIFCGKDLGITFYVHPDSATKFLPTPADLTLDERTVLTATASYKSSYAGVKDYRYHKSKRNTGITRERWDTARAAVISRKLLNRAGAITSAGRNAIGSMY